MGIDVRRWRQLNAARFKIFPELGVFENERHHAVRRLLYDYVRSPSLRHMRETSSLTKVVHDDPKPPMIGRYGSRGDVTKALYKLAYEPEPRW